MTNQQIDELLQAFEDYNYDKIFTFLKNEELKSQILAGGEFAYFDVQICQDLMGQMQDEGYDYLYSKLFEYPMCKELLVGLTDPVKIKSCLKDSKMVLDNLLRTDLLINLNSVEFLDEYIRTCELDNWEIVELIIRFGDINYMKTCCEGGSIGFEENDIFKLIKAIKEPDYIKNYIEENLLFLSDTTLADLIIATEDVEYMKSFVFRFSLGEKLQLIKATNDIDYIKDCIKNDKLGLTAIGKEYLINVINDEKYTKECIFNTSLSLESEHIRRLLLNIDDKDYIRDCLKDNKLNLTSADKIIIITDTFGQKYLIDCVEGKELDLPLKERSRLLLHIRNKEYLRKALYNEEFNLSGFIKREIILQNFSNPDEYDFIKECIESDKLGLSGVDKSILIEEINDKGYTKECILNDKLGLNNDNKIDLLITLGEKEIIEYLENHALDLTDKNFKRVLLKVFDNDFRKKIIDDKRYNLSIAAKMKIIIDSFEEAEYLEKLPWLSMFIEDYEEEFIFLNKILGDYKKMKLPSTMTIGMEIESEGDMSGYIYNYFSYQNWETKTDRSLTDGIEIVSPILHATDEESKQIYFICDMLKNIGQEVSDSCGGHIHIGANYLKSKQAWANFFEIYCNTEKILYAITNEEGKAPRDGIMRYATPMAPKVQEALDIGIVNFESEEDLDRFVLGLKEIQANEHYDEDFLPEDVLEQETHSYDRYFGMNLCNLDNGKNTIEFRLANGTIDSNLWIDNINLLGGIVAVAQELSIIQVIDNPTKEQKNKLRLFNRLKDNISDKEKFEILVQMIGLEAQGYEKRFEANIDLLIGNEALFERLSPKKPVIVKNKPVITIAEIGEAIGDVSALQEIEAGNKIASDKEERMVSIQR